MQIDLNIILAYIFEGTFLTLLSLRDSCTPEEAYWFTFTNLSANSVDYIFIFLISLNNEFWHFLGKSSHEMSWLIVWEK